MHERLNIEFIEHSIYQNHHQQLLIVPALCAPKKKTHTLKHSSSEPSWNSWMAVELPAKATAIFNPLGGMSHTEACHTLQSLKHVPSDTASSLIKSLVPTKQNICFFFQGSFPKVPWCCLGSTPRSRTNFCSARSTSVHRPGGANKQHDSTGNQVRTNEFCGIGSPFFPRLSGEGC